MTATNIWAAADPTVIPETPAWVDRATGNGHLMTPDLTRPAGIGAGFTRWTCQVCGAEAVMGLLGFIGAAFDDKCPAGGAS